MQQDCMHRLSRTSNESRRECLRLFQEGHGYKRVATLTGLNKYTVRDYLRRYKAGDLRWADRGR